MSNNNNDENGLDTPIFIDYDVKKISRNIKLEMIKEFFEKDGFKKTGEAYGNFTILRKKEKKSEKK